MTNSRLTDPEVLEWRYPVVLDEFSGIADVPKAAGLLRTELQHHYRDLALVFAGSVHGKSGVSNVSASLEPGQEVPAVS